jgi:hypothetical protein
MPAKIKTFDMVVDVQWNGYPIYKYYAGGCQTVWSHPTWCPHNSNLAFSPPNDDVVGPYQIAL